ncbi:MAG: diacylglycerol/lipid kinase family protein [Acidimicrobiales bacterium]
MASGDMVHVAIVHQACDADGSMKRVIVVLSIGHATFQLRDSHTKSWALAGAVPSAALVLVGGRHGRRGAMRGLGAAAVAVVLSRSVVALALRRLRPDPGGLLGHRRRPSGPSASAAAAAVAAFTVGTALELPVVAVPAAALAAALGIHRVVDGTDPPLALVAGGALGATVAIGSRRLWPVAPRDGADLAPARSVQGRQPSPSGEGLAVVVNPGAGSALDVDPVKELRRALPEADVIELDEGDDLVEALTRAGQGARALGVVGGDGSINAAAGVAHDADLPLFVVPGGTLNHFARDLGLDSVDDAVDAVGDGSLIAVDLACIDGTPFLNTASFGSYAELVDAREKLEGRIGKWPAMVVALVRVLRGSEPIDVEIDGERRRLWMIFIGNCGYDPPGFAPSWRKRLDDGQLDVRLVDGSDPGSRARLVLALLTGRLATCRAYEERLVRELKVLSRGGPMRLARDGETFDGSAEFSVCKKDRPLLVFAPHTD